MLDTCEWLSVQLSALLLGFGSRGYTFDGTGSYLLFLVSKTLRFTFRVCV